MTLKNISCCVTLAFGLAAAACSANATDYLGYQGTNFNRTSGFTAFLGVPTLPTGVNPGSNLSAYIVLPVTSKYSGTVNYSAASKGFTYSLAATRGYVLSNANSSIIFTATLSKGIPVSWLIYAWGDTTSSANEVWVSDNGVDAVYQGNPILTESGATSLDLDSIGYSYGPSFPTCDDTANSFNCMVQTNRVANSVANEPGVWFIKNPAGPVVSSFKSFMVLSAAPEPAAWSLMMLGLGGVGAALRRRRTAIERLQA